MSKKEFNKEFVMNATISNYSELEKSLKKAQSAATVLLEAIDEINQFIPKLSVIEPDNETTSNSESEEK